MVSVSEETNSRQLRCRDSVVSETKSVDAGWQPVQLSTRYVLLACIKPTRLTSKMYAF